MLCPTILGSEATGGNARGTGLGTDYAWLRNANLVSNRYPLQNLMITLVMYKEGQVLLQGEPIALTLMSRIL